MIKGAFWLTDVNDYGSTFGLTSSGSAVVKYASVKVDSDSVLKLSFGYVTEDNWSVDKVAFWFAEKVAVCLDSSDFPLVNVPNVGGLANIKKTAWTLE